MRIHAAEKEAGLSELIEKSVARVQAPIRLSKPGDVDKLIAHLERLAKASEVKDLVGIEQHDLAVLDAILVSTGWNLNDDVFLPAETYAARQTPMHKPINVMHDETTIIGHLITSKAVSKDGTELVVEEGKEPPADFDLEVAGVMYKDLPALADQIAEIVEAAQKGEIYVSMEAWFDDFSYAFKDSKGQVRIVARTPETAFLTKHLRIYGGPGKYEGCAVGRVLRSINFAGVGIVDNPANPESIIKRVAARAAAARIETVQKPEGGAQSMANETTQTPPAAEPVTAEQLQSKLAEAEKALQAKVEDAKTLATEIETLKAKVEEQSKALEAKTAEATEAAKAAEAAKADLQAKLDEATKRAETAEAAAKKADEDAKKAQKAKCRLAELAKVKTIADEATTLKDLSEMSDETFATVLKFAGEAKGAETQTPPAETKPAESATASLENADEDDEPEMNAGTAVQGESLMKAAKATAAALLRRETKEE